MKISSGKTITFKNAIGTHSSGFTHVSRLYVDGLLVSTKVIKYYNRTWEAYQFKTSMTQAVEQSQLLQDEKDEIIKLLEALE